MSTCPSWKPLKGVLEMLMSELPQFVTVVKAIEWNPEPQQRHAPVVEAVEMFVLVFIAVPYFVLYFAIQPRLSATNEIHNFTCF